MTFLHFCISSDNFATGRSVDGTKEQSFALPFIHDDKDLFTRSRVMIHLPVQGIACQLSRLWHGLAICQSRGYYYSNPDSRSAAGWWMQ